MKSDNKSYTEWNGPALARLRSGEDLQVTVFGKSFTVKAVPYSDSTTPHGARIEFWKDGEKQPHLNLFFANPEKNDKRFAFSEVA